MTNVWWQFCTANVDAQTNAHQHRLIVLSKFPVQLVWQGRMLRANTRMRLKFEDSKRWEKKQAADVDVKTIRNTRKSGLYLREDTIGAR